MNKPFDLADLTARLKAQGVPMAEDVAEKLVATMFDWMGESFAIHTSPYMQMLGPVVTGMKPAVMQELDKIDGVVGQ